jgi:hypothetical protein
MIRYQEAAAKSQEGGFSCAVGSYDTDKIPCVNLQFFYIKNGSAGSPDLNICNQ